MDWLFIYLHRHRLRVVLFFSVPKSAPRSHCALVSGSRLCPEDKHVVCISLFTQYACLAVVTTHEMATSGQALYDVYYLFFLENDGERWNVPILLGGKVLAPICGDRYCLDLKYALAYVKNIYVQSTTSAFSNGMILE